MKDKRAIFLAGMVLGIALGVLGTLGIQACRANYERVHAELEECRENAKQFKNAWCHVTTDDKVVMYK